MGILLETAQEVFRNLTSPGFPAEGLWEPPKADIIALIGLIETYITVGIQTKVEVRAATTANGTLASAFDNGSVIDGVTLATGNRILIKDQTAGAENGIYVVQASGAPVRATDADSASGLLGAT